ncbi:MAG TPA: hypothetical protein VJB05_00230 [archaeon]|nr:hypothetical protein [archaeon]
MPVEVTSTNPLTFRLDNGETRVFGTYALDEDPHKVTVSRKRGCVVYPVGIFNHNTSSDALYHAVVEDNCR